MSKSNKFQAGDKARINLNYPQSEEHGRIVMVVGRVTHGLFSRDESYFIYDDLSGGVVEDGSNGILWASEMDVVEAA